MSKQEEIIEVCGKKVVVRYTNDGLSCMKCAFRKSANLCQRVIDECGKLDSERVDETAYFVEVEQPEADLDAEIDSYWNKVTGYQPPFVVLELKKKDLRKVARHFAEWGAEHLKK